MKNVDCTEAMKLQTSEKIQNLESLAEKKERTDMKKHEIRKKVASAPSMSLARTPLKLEDLKQLFRSDKKGLEYAVF